MNDLKFKSGQLYHIHTISLAKKHICIFVEKLKFNPNRITRFESTEKIFNDLVEKNPCYHFYSFTTNRNYYIDESFLYRYNITKI